jgi:2-isopropylmalate synthase
MSTDRLTIFDTTLRDGEQAPGFSMRIDEKLKLARQLATLGVDLIEAGFPIASEADAESVRVISEQVQGPVIAALARCHPADIDRAGEALAAAPRRRIHVFIATSDLHLERKLRMTREACLDAAVAAIHRARRFTEDVQFSAEDATRSDMDFLCRVIQEVISAGCTTVNLPDTVGYSTPDEIGEFFRTVLSRVPNAGHATFSAHCHDDLGLAVANTLAAVRAGARQVECTVNGIGERAGNASLEEIVMATRVRADLLPYTTSIEPREIYPSSQLLTALTGEAVQANKAIVGRNAFAHEAGIHQDGMLKERTTYEIMRPEDVGFTQTDLVLGKHSGRAALADRAKALGYQLSGEHLQEVFEEFKKLADKKKEVYDADIAALIDKRMNVDTDQWQLAAFEVHATGKGSPTVSVTLRRGTEEKSQSVTWGDGPLDALFRAIEEITGTPVVVRDFRVHSVTRGTDAQGEATIEAEHQGRVYRGRGVSTDTVEAATLAFLNAVNKAVAGGGKTAGGERGETV